MTARRNAFGRQVDSFERDVTLDLDGSGAAGGSAGGAFPAVFIRAPWVADAGSPSVSPISARTPG